MSNKPVWALGYALRKAKVPCAEEIAMMLRTAEPAKEEVTYELSGFGGRYSSKYDEASNTYTYRAFAKGLFPLELYQNGNTRVSVNNVYVDHILEFTDLSAVDAKSGDTVAITYRFPTYDALWYNAAQALGGKAITEVYTYGYLYSRDSAGNETAYARLNFYLYTDKDCTEVGDVFKPVRDSVVSNAGTLFEKDSFSVEELRENGALVGVKLYGKLLHPLSEIKLNQRIYSYGNVAQNCIVKTIYSGMDDLTITVTRKQLR